MSINKFGYNIISLCTRIRLKEGKMAKKRDFSGTSLKVKDWLLLERLLLECEGTAKLDGRNTELKSSTTIQKSTGTRFRLKTTAATSHSAVPRPAKDETIVNSKPKERPVEQVHRGDPPRSSRDEDKKFMQLDAIRKRMESGVPLTEAAAAQLRGNQFLISNSPQEFKPTRE